MEGERFWSEDPQALLGWHVIPTSDMTEEQRYNTVLRAVLIISIVLSISFRNGAFMVVGIVAAWLSYLVYHSSREERFNKVQKLRENNLDIVDGQVCTRSSADNPFMNVLVGDYQSNPNRPGACPILKKEVKELAESNYEERLFKDVGDLYGNMHSQREFYTMPSTTIPNDAKSFMEWCYGKGSSCKEGNGQQCLLNLPKDPARNLY